MNTIYKKLYLIFTVFLLTTLFCSASKAADPQINGGIISTSQTIITGTAPSKLQNVQVATISTGQTPAYQWERSPDNATNTWAAISGATTISYQPPVLNKTTYYRRKVTGYPNSMDCYSNIVVIQVKSAQPSPCVNTIKELSPSNYRFQYCGGQLAFAIDFVDPARKLDASDVISVTMNITDDCDNMLTTGNFTLSQTIDAVNNLVIANVPSSTCKWDAIHNATIKIKPSGCSTEFSYSTTFKQNPHPDYDVYGYATNSICPGVISGNQTITAGSTPALLGNVQTTSNTNGLSTTYQWEQSSDNVSWKAITGATGLTYQPSALNYTTYYRRKVVSGLPEMGFGIVSNTVMVKIPTTVAEVCVDKVSVLSPYLTRIPANGGKLQLLVQYKNENGHLSTMDNISLSLDVYSCNDLLTGTFPLNYTLDTVNNIIEATIPPRSCSMDMIHAVMLVLKPAGCITEYNFNPGVKQLPDDNAIDNNVITVTTPYTKVTNSLITSTNNSSILRTFYDGLGHPIEELNAAASPNRLDMVRPIIYDAFGREKKIYLPYERTGAVGAFSPTSTALIDQESFHKALHGTTDGTVAFVEKKFETSPLSRIVEETLPGAAWKMDAGHTVKYNYTANASGEVKLWKADVATSALSQSTNYAAGQLYVTETTDPDGLKVREYKDKQGNIVERWQIDKNNAVNKLVTSYVYDEFGRLRVVIPPKAQALTANSTDFNNLVYRYSYNKRGRMTEKKLPDKDLEYMVYDNRDRLVMAQDGEMRAKAKWKVLLYDQLNRPVAEALIACTKTRAELETAFANAAFSQTRAGSNNYYTHNNITLTGVPAITTNDVIKYTFYDDWKWTGATPIAYNETVAGTAVTVAADRLSGTVKGQVTGSRIKAYDNNELTASAKWLTDVTQYDKKYRAIQAVGDLYDGTTGTTSKGVISSRYHFDGAVERTREEQTFNSVKNTVDVRFEYDHARRPVKVWNKINSQTEQLLATTAYDALGRAKTKTLGNGEAVTYAYNIRDWLTKISSSKFTTDLYYNTLPTLPTGVTGAAQWGGNIAAATWKQGTGTLQTYGYNYDAFNRLNSGLHGGGMNEKAITYDANGNIATLTRDGGTNPGIYTYTYSGNKLVTLKIGSTSYNYTYDANGNTTTDGLRGFAISYNLLNLPKKVSKGTDNIEYIYDADGNKLAKKKNGAFVNFYCGSMVYKADKSIEYIAHSEGLAMKGSTTFDYQYNLTDHLGNVRTVLDANKTALQTNDYYPFGLTHAAVANVAKNKYLYNGKELQNDIIGGTLFGMLDYGARFYDGVTGRWHTIDPMAEKYHPFSPYAYCANNPIKFIDPTGEMFYISFFGDNATEARKLFEQNVNSILNKQYTVTLTETSKGSGVFEVGLVQAKGGSKDNLSKGAKSFHEGLSGVINSKTVTNMQAVYGDKDVDTGQWTTGKLDMADVNQFPEFNQTQAEQVGPTKQSKIMHEIREQFMKAAGEKNYNRAHANALNWEDHVNGNTRERVGGNTQFFWRTDRTRNGGILYKTKLSTWNIDTKSPIIKVKRTD